MNKKRYHTLTAIAFSLTVIFLASCGGDSDKKTSDDALDGEAAGYDTSAIRVKTQNIFYSVPSPVETALLIKNAGIPYNKKLLNPIENVSKYSTLKAQALALGVYGTDLSFTSIYDQSQESMLYLRCANSLSSQLGINGAFGEETVSRIEANMDNKDSLLRIISESYWESDSYLKENQRPGIAALILAGGWIEGLYLAAEIVKTKKNDAIRTRVAEQKFSLDNLIGLLDSYGEEATNKETINALKDLKLLYDELPTTKAGSATSKTDAKTNITTIGGAEKVQMTDEQFEAIYQKAVEMRNKII